MLQECPEFETLYEDESEEDDDEGDGICDEFFGETRGTRMSKLNLDVVASASQLPTVCSSGTSPNKCFAGSRRRGMKEESHPKRQSTPRRRLLEARLADQAFQTGTTEGKLNDSDVLITPRLLRSSSCFSGFNHDGHPSVWISGLTATSSGWQSARQHSETKIDFPGKRSGAETARESLTLNAVSSLAEQVASASLLAGTRNVALYKLSASYSARVLPTYYQQDKRSKTRNRLDNNESDQEDEEEKEEKECKADQGEEHKTRDVYDVFSARS